MSPRITSRPPTPLAAGLRRREFLALAAVACLPARALAEGAWPARSISLVVPFPAGGASDVGARMINGELGRQLGQAVVVDNVGGAGGALGVQKAVRAAPDGYTLLYGSLSETLLVPMLNPKAGYKTEDLLPVAFVGATPAVFVTRPDFPASSIDEFVALARRNPGKFSYGSPGVGTFQHLMGEAFKARADVFMVHIPYRGGAQILNDVVGGQIDLGITSAVNAAGFVSSGRLKAIGVTSAQRSQALKDTQAFGESAALKGLELSTWGMVYAPAGTPESVVQRLNAAINGVLMQPAVAQQRARLGAELPSVMSPEQARAFVAAERDKYLPIARRIKLD